MAEEKTIAEIDAWAESLVSAHGGSISRKRIRGKDRYYLQWRERGKYKSVYLKAAELEAVRRQLARRKELVSLLGSPSRVSSPGAQLGDVAVRNDSFETPVRYGELLKQVVEGVSHWEHRDCFPEIMKFLEGKTEDRILAIYGLRRTGKTTMLRQAIGALGPVRFAQTAYVKVRDVDTTEKLGRDLDRLYRRGFRYVFVDEVTLMEDFIDCAAVFSDVYAPMGMKIVLSGTDSLGFWLSEKDELYDRAYLVHTTYIPYQEHRRLLGTPDIDAYIRFGGTLRAGSLEFGKVPDDASFRDDESTREYVDTAIARNIQHSLLRFKDGRYLPAHLAELARKNELTDLINRIVEDMNHRFVAEVLQCSFKSHDLGISAHNLLVDRIRRSDVLSRVDKPAVTTRLKAFLDILDCGERSEPFTQGDVVWLGKYLAALDLTMEVPVVNIDPAIPIEKRTLFTQPGMRYSQAQALVLSLVPDSVFAAQEYAEMSRIADRILADVRGRRLEDIVLMETSRFLSRTGSSRRAFKLMYPRGEYDLVVADPVSAGCALYEVKHSLSRMPDQARHLRDEEMLAAARSRFGLITARTVLYRGEDFDEADGVRYRNAENYLASLV